MRKNDVKNKNRTALHKQIQPHLTNSSVLTYGERFGLRSF